MYLIPEALLRHWRPLGCADAREGKKESARRRSIRTTARIINNKGIGTGDWWLHHDWRSIHHLFALLTKDWPGTSAALPFVSSLLSFFLRSLLRRAALPRYYRARSYYPVCPCSARPRRTTYRDLTFLRFELRWLCHFRILLFGVHLLRFLRRAPTL